MAVATTVAPKTSTWMFFCEGTSLNGYSRDMTTRGPYPKGVQRRREILDRALEVFAEKGFESTSLRAIGEAIGVSHAALSHYFESREALLVEVLRERDLQGAEAIADIDGVLERTTVIAEHNKNVPGLVGLHTVMMASAVEPGHEVATEFFTDRFERGRESTRAALEHDLAERGIAPGVDLDDLASLIMAASDGLQVQWLLDDRIDIPRILALIERIVVPARTDGA
ncbi:TetR family transcriptional regulator [Frondihabitans sp. PhB188]|nr:TetR family transcriptional regulator [Frondihabitans sp. PhB188]